MKQSRSRTHDGHSDNHVSVGHEGERFWWETALWDLPNQLLWNLPEVHFHSDSQAAYVRRKMKLTWNQREGKRKRLVREDWGGGKGEGLETNEEWKLCYLHTAKTLNINGKKYISKLGALEATRLKGQFRYETGFNDTWHLSVGAAGLHSFHS